MTQDMIPWLYGLQHFGVKLGLDNIRATLELLDHPERAYPSMIVAGTNGKGSVAAMVESVLGASGLPTGLFTSPHLMRPNERIRLAGTDIETGELNRQLEAMARSIAEGLKAGRLAAHPSFFEVVTATALQSFKEHGMRAAVLEVGLGGRLDATNAVEAEVAVVVNVDLDHTKTLGGTVELIAAEKAGVVKPGRPLVSGVTQQRAVEVLREVCRARGATMIDGRAAAWLERDDGCSFDLVTRRQRYADLRLPLPGRHQVDNARIAVAAFEELAERVGLRPDPEAVRRGLAAVRWAGRLQWWEPERGGPRFLLDAAHNPAGMATLNAFLVGAGLPQGTLLFGATRGKPLDELLEPLSRFTDRVVLTRPPVDKGIDPEEVLPLATRWFPRVETAPEPDAAIAVARELAGPDGWVLTTGSLYLVGEILGRLTGVQRMHPLAM